MNFANTERDRNSASRIAKDFLGNERGFSPLVHSQCLLSARVTC